MSALMKPGWFKFIFIFCSILGLLFGLLPGPAEAQEEPGGGAVYIVQEGDYLSDIARRFGVSTDEIISLNGITNPNQLNVGTELRIPGLDWIDGKLVTETIGFGESFRSIARKLGTEPDLLARLNRITSPNELYTGASLIFVE
ncbi:MAG: LysM peptidoglycan-binding domain-containing protein, partial [Chloroflexi bacterium]